MWYWVVTKFYTVSVDVDVNGKIVAAPPIVRWSIGKGWDEYLSYVKRKGILIEYEEKYDK